MPVKALSKDKVLRREPFCRRRLEGAWKAEARLFAEYDPLRVHPINLRCAKNSPKIYGVECLKPLVLLCFIWGGVGQHW